MHDGIFDGLPLRETGCGDARTQILDIRLGNSTVNGRIAVVAADVSVVADMWALLVG